VVRYQNHICVNQRNLRSLYETADYTDGRRCNGFAQPCANEFACAKTEMLPVRLSGLGASDLCWALHTAPYGVNMRT